MPNGCSGNFWQDYNFRLASNPKRGIRRRACDGKCCQCPEKPDCSRFPCTKELCWDGKGRREIDDKFWQIWCSEPRSSLWTCLCRSMRTCCKCQPPSRLPQAPWPAVPPASK